MILAIETSCDDSAVALLEMNGEVVVSEISSQVDLHEKYGGVVPELASRKHLLTLPILLRHALESAGASLNDLEAIAVTYSPGLIGSLLVGVNYAKTLSWIAGVPLVPVDHLEGHLLAPFLDHPDLTFPYLSLIASGGHTHLMIAEGLGEYRLLGKTIDDAAGEAYDKVAKMMGFKYPGGPIIEKLAGECPRTNVELPIPLRRKKTLNFSFSGLKTAVRNEAIKRNAHVEKRKLVSLDEFMRRPETEVKRSVMEIAAGFQKIMSKIITLRFEEALKLTNLERMTITGGVAANKGIIKSLKSLADRLGKKFYFPRARHCTDNAAMIGYCALKRIETDSLDPKRCLTLNASSRSFISQMEIDSSFK